MNRMLGLMLVGLLWSLTLFAQAVEDKPFVESAKKAVALLYSQDFSGGMKMHCTITAYKKDGDVYSFVSASHCVGADDTSKERSARAKGVPFFITFDEHESKRFLKAEHQWSGYQHRGHDFAVFTVRSTDDWPVIELGDEQQEYEGASYWNFASPLGLGVQVMTGQISKLSLDRPVVEGDINWAGALVLQQAGVNGGSSGSALVSVTQKKIVGFLVGTIGGGTIVGIPVSRFKDVSALVEKDRYRYHKVESDEPDDEAK
jgi:hypothetical protein